MCADKNCRNPATDTGLRITETDGSFSLEVDKSEIDADPELTRWFKVISHSEEIIEEFTIFLLDCVTDQEITLIGEALAPITRELGKNNGL